jgi:hypothetical protein
MFFCTVACALIRVADKTHKAAETPAVTCYPAALTADFPLKQQRVGEMHLFPFTVPFAQEYSRERVRNKEQTYNHPAFQSVDMSFSQGF